MPDIRVTLDNDLHGKLKATAALQRKNIKEIVVEIIKAYIDQRKGLGR